MHIIANLNYIISSRTRSAWSRARAVALTIVLRLLRFPMEHRKLGVSIEPRPLDRSKRNLTQWSWCIVDHVAPRTPRADIGEDRLAGCFPTNGWNRQWSSGSPPGSQTGDTGFDSRPGRYFDMLNILGQDEHSHVLRSTNPSILLESVSWYQLRLGVNVLCAAAGTTDD
jgi:hypothetical protein